MNPSLYIPGIDGLRALSVIAVICYHLDSSLLPGGYTGVDVFFVISGYVISKSLAGSSFSSFTDYITGFYKRRIVRIFPALVVCLLATSVGTVLFIPESWLSGLNGKTGVAAFFGLSNFILLLFDDGYFAPRGEFNPFLHTWSLAVEEQFYFLFPPIFYAWLRFRERQNLVGIISRHSLGALFLLSLVFAFFTTRNNPVLAFYLLPSRLWELAAGVILFQIQQRWQKKSWPRWLLITLSLAGSGCLICSFVLPALLRFPCPWGGISVVGAFALLAAIVQSGAQKTVIMRFLASAPMSYVGKLSYSLYLWHWPIFSLSRWTNGFDDKFEKLFAVLLAFILAAVSFHIVEQPIRNAGALKKQRSSSVLIKGVTVIVFCSLFSATLFLIQTRLSLSVTRDRYTWYPYASDIDDKVKTGKMLEGKKMFVMGDSHTGAYTTMLEKISEKTSIEVIPLTKGGCPVLNLLKPLSDGAACSAALTESLNVIRSEAKEGDVVFLASLRMVRYGNQWETYAEKDVKAKQKATRDPVRRAEIESEADSFIDELGKIGLKVLIDAPKPIFKAPAFRCSDWFNQSNPVCGPGFTLSRAQLEKDRKPVMETLDKLAKANVNLSVWDPFPILCPGEECEVMDHGNPLFFDGDHLSGYGNLVLLPSFEKHLLSMFEKDQQ